jgi:hypothetical protein
MKRLRSAFFCLFLLTGSLPGCALSGGDRPDSRAIMSFLASDSLKGRGSFTPENEKAAAFIAGEFRSLGLIPLPGEDSLEVRFPVHRLRVLPALAVLNGVALPDSEVLVSTGRPSVRLDDADSLKVLRMGEKFDRAMMREKNCLILVPRTHAGIFGRYRNFWSRPDVTLEEPGRDLTVALLTDADTVTGFTLSAGAVEDTPTLVNVIGVLPGKRSGEAVLISAHYDHLGVLPPVEGDSIANGANDDASGTTAVLELARYFGSRGTPERTLIFAAFGGEELGMLGSRYLAGRIDPDSLVAMVNLEMIGTVSKFGPHSFWITGFDKSDLGSIVGEDLKGTAYSVYPDPYPELNLFFRSDNASFSRKGVPAHSFSTDPIDSDTLYHTVKDEIGSIDIGHLDDIIRGIALGIGGIVDGRRTPARIKPDR